MARVEWSALSGDEVETVLSNLLYNKDERSLRIRPDQGDYGIDVIVPAQADTNKWDVYQIKKFAQNLSANQKSQIEKSFRRVLVAMVRRGVPLNNWYLAAPLDPTLHNLMDWFNTIPTNAVAAIAVDEKLALTKEELQHIRSWLEAPDRIIGWKALSFCEQLAADYPYVVDYYLHGGEARIRDAVSDLSRLLGLDMALRPHDGVSVPDGDERSAALLEPGEVREHLYRLDRVLDTDPHFRYGYSLDLHRPDLQPEPRLVAATQESIPGGRWLTFKIYQRSPQSLDERPIPLRLDFDFEDSPEDREALEVWRKYGKPLEVTASVTADLPGGLHGETATGRVRLSPAMGDEATFRNRFRIVDTQGTVLTELRFAMSSTTGLDQTGTWAHGVDDSGLLAVESMIDATAKGGDVAFTIEPLAGREAAKILGAVLFASHLASPNTLQAAGEYGPFFDFTLIGLSEPLVAPALARLVQSLATIQTVTSTPILIPDFSTLSSEEFAAIGRAAALIGGRTLVGTWQFLRIEQDQGVGLDHDGHYQIAVIEPLRLNLNGQDIALGGVEKKALSARVASAEGDSVRVVPHLNDAIHAGFLPDFSGTPDGTRIVRYRRAPDMGGAPHGDQSL